ncbi:hypothetical protein LINGRAHAP2_LOCUS31671, partial [Linum grandiflorum]
NSVDSPSLFLHRRQLSFLVPNNLVCIKLFLLIHGLGIEDILDLRWPDWEPQKAVTLDP